ncbi:MAG: hypothetical protein ACK5LM_00860 [Lactovum sp.]
MDTMINGMTVMMYVKNVNRAVNFWTAIGFDEIHRVSLESSESVALTNPEFGNVMLQIYEEYYVKEKNPKLILSNPSLLFSVEDIDLTYELISAETKQISDIMPAAEEFTFNFNDFDGNQFSVRGPRIEHGISEEEIANYFDNLKRVKLISARDVEFLPDNALIFFGRVTSELSREIAEELSTVNSALNYVDTQNAKISSDLQVIMKKYAIEETDTALIRRMMDGSFKQFESVMAALKN